MNRGNKLYLTYLLFCVAILTTALPARGVAAQSLEPTPPPGFYLVRSAPGVELYRKDYPNGTPDYVQVVDLSQGASVRLLHGRVADPGYSRGMHGGDSASFQRKAIQKHWQDLKVESERAFCVSNGVFFRITKGDPVELPLPLKVDGEILSVGDKDSTREFPGEKLMLELLDGYASIRPYTPLALERSFATNILGGLAETASKRSNKAVGRTFVGVDDPDGNGRAEVLLIFNTATSLPEDAAEVLRLFSADAVMMLDGGGSTQLVCQGEVIINTDRPIPQALGVIAGESLPENTPTPESTPSPVEDKIIAAPAAQDSQNPPATMQRSGAKLDLSNVLYVPILMLPVALVVAGLILYRLKSQEV